MTSPARTLEIARDLLAFIDASPSPFHCVAEATRRLEAAGWQRRSEADPWSPAPGERALVERGDGSLVAWRMGTQPPPEAGFRIVGAHTDSPGLRLKPRLAKSNQGYLLLDVDVYGGVLLATWTDRDLGLAGRLVVDGDEGPRTHLLRIHRPLCRIPNLAIHLNREVNDKGLVLNKHQHLSPVLGILAVEGDPCGVVTRLLADAAGVEPDRVLGHDVCLYDLQAGTVSGLHDEFVHTARLDDQAMCHAAVSALLEADADPAATAAVALFDHEEVGSLSARGADGSLLEDVLSRLAGPGREERSRAFARSHQISTDMAHAVHPSYADAHDAGHAPRLNAGPVVKTNYNQRYATDAATGALFRRLCRRSDVPVQEFVNRPDLACGSTIGPISAARLGISTVDVGNPMLSMHSVREMAGSRDAAMMIRVLTAFLSDR